MRDAEDVDERVLEQGIVQNIKQFIMTFGRAFAFVGNQYHLDAFGIDQYIDLLFFNRDLNCLVAVELKSGPFKPPISASSLAIYASWTTLSVASTRIPP